MLLFTQMTIRDAFFLLSVGVTTWATCVQLLRYAAYRDRAFAYNAHLKV